MTTFIFGILFLWLGYFFYGRMVERNFGPVEERKTPAFTLADGSDYVPMGRNKNSIIQLLNIAGTGPVFGPILGALYGPVAFLWIVLGCVFAGAVHDYYTGMISLRNNGAFLPSLVGKYIGSTMRHIVNAFSALLLLLVGVVFVISPAKLIQQTLASYSLVSATSSEVLFVIVICIFIYYLLSTILPINKIIGSIYPIFGIIMVVNTIAIGVSLLLHNGSSYQMPELTLATFKNLNPSGTSIFPGLFFTISCGAISGFHATQSPMISRTIENEKQGRFVFYGMMIAEGVIAMIWAAAAMALFDGKTLMELIQEGTPSVVVDKISMTMLGSTFGTLAILGVIILPITSGDSSFRALRLTISEYVHLPQQKLKNKLIITIPIFVVGYALTKIDFQLLWRYFNWANQVTAVIALFVVTRYLMIHRKHFWHTLIPAVFMLYQIYTYILAEKIGFGLDLKWSYLVAAFLTSITTWYFYRHSIQHRDRLLPTDPLINDHLLLEDDE